MRLKVMMSLTKRRLRQACGACFQFFVRKDKLTNPDDKALNEGKVYNFSFAVHDDNITTRDITFRSRSRSVLASRPRSKQPSLNELSVGPRSAGRGAGPSR